MQLRRTDLTVLLSDAPAGTPPMLTRLLEGLHVAPVWQLFLLALALKTFKHAASGEIIATLLWVLVVNVITTLTIIALSR